MSKIHGRASIRVNGQFFDSDDDASLMPGGVKNNGRPSSSRFYYNQTFIASKVVCNVPVRAETSLRELQEIADAEIHFTSDVGRTYIIKGAAQTGEVELTGGTDGGKVELTFEGEPAEEMVI